MAIRMTGIISGLDTEGIIKELMEAHNAKKTKIENKITKHEWKQEKWKELNTKIYALYTGTLSKAKTQGSYLTKTVTSSNDSKVTATATTNAVNGTHRICVNKMASAQYVTGAALGKYTDAEGEEQVVSGTTKLTELDFEVSDTMETQINIAAGDKKVTLAVTDKTTVSDFVDACKSAGLNASYDTAQKRFFISAADSGAENAFSITTSTAGDTAQKNAVRDLLDYSKLNSTARVKVDNALLTYKDEDATDEEKEAALDAINTYAANKTYRDLVDKYKAGEIAGKEDELAQIKADAEAEYLAGLKDGETPDETAKKEAIDAAVLKKAEEYANEQRTAFEEGATTGNAFYDATEAVETALSAYAAASSESAGSIAGNSLERLGLGEVSFTKVDGKLIYTTTGDVALVEASDSEIEYNGAILTGSSNTIIANGLTINVNGVTAGTDEEYISVNVSKDTQAVYDMVKAFVKEYNEVLDALNTSYNAASARGYDPLTDEEREQMTEEQIEKWENKIKDSLLRRDSTVSGLVTSMKNSMQKAVFYNGKQYSLGSLGIGTTDYTEYGKLHINGDKDDAAVSDKTDKLMAAIEEDPEMVMEVMTQLASGL
ncbi:MAG: flagellar filament capping protein FliD, partial [Lachnospiraceae bacterium]|nr:flagellar filament capping protein FliD [Lachnospiraceae bacterium]